MKTIDQIVKVPTEQLEHYADEYCASRLSVTSSMTFESYLIGRLCGWNYEDKPVKEMKQA